MSVLVACSRPARRHPRGVRELGGIGEGLVLADCTCRLPGASGPKRSFNVESQRAAKPSAGASA